jgi:GNAT superfamily N-acetyltransferase
MTSEYFIKRTTTSDPDFKLLVSKLDHELWNELKEDQATYDPFNKVDQISTAVVVYYNNEPVACGCFKEFAGHAVEIKRMFVDKTYRGKGLSKQVLKELELWAMEKNYSQAVLETSIHFQIARNLYMNCGYAVIPNYGPYEGLTESVCMKKSLPVSA